MLPKISVVIPSYNQGTYLAHTLDSVLSQQYPALEIILIDGGSADNTLDVIRAYTHHLAYWVSEPDRGQSHALNKGFQRATGEIIAWLNSDDWYCNGTLLTVGRIFARHPGWQILYGNALLADEAGTVQSRITPGEINLVKLLSHWIPAYVPPQPSIFFKSSLLQAVGGLDEQLQYAMDYDLWLRMARIARFHYYPADFSCQRMHTHSKSFSEGGFNKFEPEWALVRNRCLETLPKPQLRKYLLARANFENPTAWNKFKMILTNLKPERFLKK